MEIKERKEEEKNLRDTKNKEMNEANGRRR